MKAIVVAVVSTLVLAAASHAWAHGSHPKCKKGYVLNDEHKCVKKN